jgi:hypothetical protein
LSERFCLKECLNNIAQLIALHPPPPLNPMPLHTIPDAGGGQAKLNVSKDSSFVGQKQYQAEKNVQQSCLLFPATQPTSTVSRFV